MIAYNNIPNLKNFNSDPEIDKWIAQCLPPDYNFEVYKTLKRIEANKVQHVALQFPEGLLTYSTQISQILKKFTTHKLSVTIMGDVTYGACCIDDFAARAIGCDLLVHYGHSCLVPISVTLLNCMYVFVDILFDPTHLYETLKLNFDPNTQFALMSTIQYVKPLHGCGQMIKDDEFFEYAPFIPQKTPLTSGEVLGCTSPILQLPINKNFNNNNLSTTSKISETSEIEDKIKAVTITCKNTPESNPDIPKKSLENISNNTSKNITEKFVKNENNFKSTIDCAIFVADGRFHLESALIQNPSIQFYRYDPFTRKLFREYYDHDLLHTNRKAAIVAAQHAKTIGVVMGTLGRQGNIKIVEAIQALLTRAGKVHFTILMCEILPYKLKNLAKIDAFIQIACPRLSIDWGHYFHKPLLNPYEAFVAFGNQQYLSVYPMDFYSKEGGAWTNYHEANNRPQQNRLQNDDQLDKKALIRKKLALKREMKGKQLHNSIQYGK